MPPPVHPSSFFRPLLSVLRARKLVILLALILVPAVAAGFSLTQKPLYQASSQLLVSRTNLGNVLTGTQDPAAQEFDFNRIVQTEAQLAASRAVATRTIRVTGLRGQTPQQFLAQSAVLTDPSSDILTLRVTAGTPTLATRLAAIYALQFVAYSQTATLGPLRRAASQLTAQLRHLAPTSQLAGQDNAELQRIRNLESLGNSTISIVETAAGATQTQPQTVRNVIIGVILGLAIGIGLAFVMDRLDTHVRTSEEIHRRLGVPLLGYLPAPPKKLAKNDRIVMLAEPAGHDAENFRMLRTNMMFADIDRRVRAVLLTSAVESEGKSTTISNVAVALAHGGQRVILADLDFRKPAVERFFDLPRQPGITSVLIGEASLEQALVGIPLAGMPGVVAHRASENGAAPAEEPRQDGTLHVLSTGGLPPNPGDLVTSTALRDLVKVLRDQCDLLLIDTPPLLQVGDAMALTTEVDAIVLVARLGVVRRRMLGELTRRLAVSPAPTLGVVITDATAEPGGYDYGYYGSYGEATPASRRAAGEADQHPDSIDAPLRSPVR